MKKSIGRTCLNVDNSELSKWQKFLLYVAGKMNVIRIYRFLKQSAYNVKVEAIKVKKGKIKYMLFITEDETGKYLHRMLRHG